MEDECGWKTTFDGGRYYRSALDTAVPLWSFLIHPLPSCGNAGIGLKLFMFNSFTIIFV